MLPEEGIRVSQMTVAQTANGLVVYGVDPLTDADFQIPFALFQKLANDAITLAGQAKSTADTAKTEADTANNALPLKAAHGYGALPQKTLKEVEDAANTSLQTKAAHGYTGTPKTLKEVDDSVVQLAGEVSELELKDVVQSDKIKSIENVISTMNPSQSAQLSVSGRKVISLPKNASNGGMQVKLEGLTAQNLVVNGDFRNGTTGWTLANGISISDNEELVETDQAQFTTQDIATTNNGKIYISITVKGVSGVAPQMSVFDNDSNNNPSSVSGTLSGIWERISLIRSSANGGVRVLLGHWGSAMPIEVYYDKVIVIDLTAIFGPGNEITDVPTLDKIFSTYFEGTKSFVPTGRVRSDVGGRNLVLNSKAGWESTAYKIMVGQLSNDVTIGETYTASWKGSTSVEVMLWLGDGVINLAYLNRYDPETDIHYNTFVIPANYVPTNSPTFSVYNAPPEGAVTKIEWLKIEKGNRATSWTPAPEDVRDGVYPATGTSLYLTAPDLKSNGTVKDEIRKGANGYEHVKRVGVGITLGAEKITGGDFEVGLIGSMRVDASSSIASYSLNSTTPISGLNDVRLAVTTVGTEANRPLVHFDGYMSRTIGEFRLISFDYKVNSGNCILSGYYDGIDRAINKPLVGSGHVDIYCQLSSTVGLHLYFDGRNLFDVQIDNISEKVITPIDGAIADGSAFTEYPTGVHYTLATPIITPIDHAGILNLAESGTVYHEPIVADAGVYGTNMPILLTDYPISALEEIIIHKDGIDTYLDVSTAVIAGDKLSFTHPSLQSGDLVLFTYAFAKETTNGNITATFYDSNVVKIDTVTGKAYRINEVVTNGVLTRTLTEV